MNRSRQVFLGLIVVALLPCSALGSTHHPRPAPATATSPSPATLTTQQIAARVTPSIVTITVMGEDGKPEALGTGIVITDGFIATNLHVIADAHTATVTFSNGTITQVDAIANWSTTKDIAILKANTSGAPPIKHDGPEPAVGDPVVAIGNPQGLLGSVSEGIVSGFRNLDDGVRVIQTTAPISQGSSGGALIDHRGNLVGMTSFQMVEGQNLNFAHPTADIVSVASAPHAFTLKELGGHWDMLTGDKSGEPDAQHTSAGVGELSDVFNKMKVVKKPAYQCGPVYVFIEQADGTRTLSHGDLIDHVIAKLKTAGVTTCSQAEYKSNANAVFLDITTVAVKEDDGTWSCRADMSLLEDAIVMRGKPIRATVTTWATDSTQNADTVSEGVYNSIDPTIESFVEDYKQDPAKE